MQINETIVIKPLSVNNAWQGRRFKTKTYDAFIDEMLLTMPKRAMIEGICEMRVRIYLKSIIRSDIDNFLKPLLDCIVKKGWIEDDRYIQKLIVEKRKAKIEGFSIMIWKDKESHFGDEIDVMRSLSEENK